MRANISRRPLQTFLLVAALLALPAAVKANDFIYTTNLDLVSITITSYTGAGGNVTIPDTIDGFTIASIGDYAFFWDYSLTSVTIPSSAISIGNDAFLLCGRLTAITVDVLNPAYSSIDWVLFDKDQTALFQFPEGKTGSYAVADSVRSITDGAFFGSRLTNASIGNCITTIGLQTFGSCFSLTSISIGNSVSNIGNGAFTGCRSLANVSIPTNVISIGDGAFESCTNLTSVWIGSGVTVIDTWAFIRCSSLTNVMIPRNVVRIGDDAFGECST